MRNDTQPVLCVTNPDKSAKRLVFSVGPARRNGIGDFIVVKMFGNDVASVKTWNNASLMTTASFWKTKIEFIASELEIREARNAICYSMHVLSKFVDQLVKEGK